MEESKCGSREKNYVVDTETQGREHGGLSQGTVEGMERDKRISSALRIQYQCMVVDYWIRGWRRVKDDGQILGLNKEVGLGCC
jgi:hypothetical protein